MKLVIGITAPLSVILIKGQLKYFSDLGYDVYLLAPKTQETLDFCQQEKTTLLPVDIKRDMSLFSDFKSLFIIWRHFHKVKPDIVNVGTPKMGLLGSIAAYLCSVPKRIYTSRGFRFEHEQGFKRKLLRTLDKFAITLSHQVVCISDSVKSLGLKENMFPKDKAVIFGKGSSNGLDLSFFNPQLYSQESILKLKIDFGLKDKFVFGFVGRIVDRKGVTELYNAFRNVQLIHKDSHLLIVGKANLEQVEDKTLMGRLENDENVTLTGYVNNINDYLAVMDVFVLPAWWEGFGNTLIQAAAMGLPIISCDVTGCRDAVNGGFNGHLIPPKDEIKLTEMMLMLKENKIERDRLGENGVEWAKNFDSTIIWKGLRKLYEE